MSNEQAKKYKEMSEADRSRFDQHRKITKEGI